MLTQDIRLLELHFSQLTRVWNKSKDNNYSDTKKQTYQDTLTVLFQKLQDENFSTLKDTQITSRYQIIDFFFKSLEFLDNSTLNNIPFEIIKCLECVLNDWLDNKTNEHIIVTSLVNRMNDFSFDNTLALNSPKYSLLKQIYNIEFNNKLIQINLPRYLSKDYLANVVIYHELGHFIDNYFQISQGLKDQICDDYILGKIQGNDKLDIEIYFPFLKINFSNDDKRILLSMHIAEYFSDIFASQYIYKCSGYYLDYVTQKNTQFNASHPSTVNRNEIVKKFLNGDIDSYTLNNLKEATKRISKKELKKRYSDIDKADFLNLVPIEIKNDAELHFLYILGWNLWLNDVDSFKNQNKMSIDLPQDKVYDIINNLIEKSIGNYIVKTNWEKLSVSS